MVEVSAAKLRTQRAYVLITLVVLSRVEITWEIIAAGAWCPLRKALNWVRTLSTAQVRRFGSHEEVLLHVCSHLHFLSSLC